MNLQKLEQKSGCSYDQTLDENDFIPIGDGTTIFSTQTSEGALAESRVSRHHKLVICTLNKLASHESIKVTKPDKGDGIVILDGTSYKSEMKLRLANATELTKVNEDWKGCLYRNQDEGAGLMENLFRSNRIGEDATILSENSGSRFGIMYGSPKVH